MNHLRAFPVFVSKSDLLNIHKDDQVKGTQGDSLTQFLRQVRENTFGRVDVHFEFYVITGFDLIEYRVTRHSK